MFVACVVASLVGMRGRRENDEDDGVTFDTLGGCDRRLLNRGRAC